MSDTITHKGFAILDSNGEFRGFGLNPTEAIAACLHEYGDIAEIIDAFRSEALFWHEASVKFDVQPVTP